MEHSRLADEHLKIAQITITSGWGLLVGPFPKGRVYNQVGFTRDDILATVVKRIEVTGKENGNDHHVEESMEQVYFVPMSGAVDASGLGGANGRARKW